MHNIFTVFGRTAESRTTPAEPYENTAVSESPETVAAAAVNHGGGLCAAERKTGRECLGHSLPVWLPQLDSNQRHRG